MIRRLTSRQTAHHTGRHALTVALMLMTLCLLVGASAATAGGGQDQPAVPVDSPWLPWLGCWQLVEETGALAEQPGNARPFADRVVVCLSPAGTAGADASGMAVTTIADGERCWSRHWWPMARNTGSRRQRAGAGVATPGPATALGCSPTPSSYAMTKTRATCPVWGS